MLRVGCDDLKTHEKEKVGRMMIRSSLGVDVFVHASIHAIGMGLVSSRKNAWRGAVASSSCCIWFNSLNDKSFRYVKLEVLMMKWGCFKNFQTIEQ